jgi:hypothetical protein
VLLHAGMPKTGSTSLQTWLARERRSALRDRGVQVLVAWPWLLHQRRPGVALGPPVLGRADSRRLGHRLNLENHQAGALAESLFEQLDRAADDAAITVLSSEALAERFARADERFLAGLDALGRRREVRVAYYVRPQDEALEAAWRQWGFRAPVPPSLFVKRRAPHHDYFRTLETVRELAPNVSFEPRPCRRDLLAGGNVVDDFARHFLGLSSSGNRGPDRELWANRGLPLPVVNALRAGESGGLWSSRHDNRRFRVVKRLAADLEVPESEAIRRSRLVVRAYAHETFEAGNRRLIAELGWPTDAFVAPVEDDLSDEELSLPRLDELWAPEASEAELAFLRAAVEQASSMRGSLRLLHAQLRRDV